MRKILPLLAGEGSFLDTERGYRITDSHYHPSFGGVGDVILSGDVLDLRFWLDRDRLFLDVRASRADRRRPSGGWFSIGIVRQKLTGEIGNDLVDPENMRFLRSHLGQIENMFSHANLAILGRELSSLEGQRSERLFGS